MKHQTIRLSENDYFPDFVARLDSSRLIRFLNDRNLINVEDTDIKEFCVLGVSRPGAYNCFILLEGKKILYSFLFNLEFRLPPNDVLIEFAEGNRIFYLMLSNTLKEIEPVISSVSYQDYEIEIIGTARDFDVQIQNTPFQPRAEGSILITEFCMILNVDSTRICMDRRPVPNQESYGMSILLNGKRYFIITVMPSKSLLSG